ncbi:MAG TPA: HDIG domain-containing protein, partial [bacterium]
MKKIQDVIKRKSNQKKIKLNNGNKQTILDRYLWTISITVLVIFIITLMLPKGKSYKYTDLKEKEVYLGEEIIAPFTFAINKTDEEYKKDLQRADDEVLPVFSKKDSISDHQLSLIAAFFDSVEQLRNGISKLSLLTQEFNRLLVKYNIKFLDENLSRLINGRTSSILNEQLIRIGRDICSVGILNVSKQEIKTFENKISVLTINEEFIEEFRLFYDTEELKEVILAKLRAAFEDDELSIRIGYQILTTFLKSNVIYDDAETRHRVAEARKTVARAKGTVLEKERIIDRYEKITKDHVIKLQSLAEEIAEREAGQSAVLAVLRYFGKFLLVTLVISILGVFLIFTRRNILDDLKRVVLIAVVFTLVMLLAYNIIRFGLSPYLIPITIGSMLLTIFYDTRVGFVGTIVLSILIGSLRGNEFNIAVISMFVGTVAVLSVSRIKTRKWLFNSILMVAGAYLFSITVMEILRYTSFRQILTYWFYGAINGFISVLLVYGLQVIFEYFFDIVTDMRLLELSDLNNPLLRKLAIEAPGTYHHSLMVGNLAESAAEAIGANTLLARVGSYYHDIGKIEKREYFIENQTKIRNPHEKLSPTMSCLILINHVKKGQEIAKKFKIPEEIRDFIAEHHGTNLISFFYQKAVEKSDGKEIDEAIFRYPGPRPKSKETAI